MRLLSAATMLSSASYKGMLFGEQPCEMPCRLFQYIGWGNAPCQAPQGHSTHMFCLHVIPDAHLSAPRSAHVFPSTHAYVTMNLPNQPNQTCLSLFPAILSYGVCAGMESYWEGRCLQRHVCPVCPVYRSQEEEGRLPSPVQPKRSEINLLPYMECHEVYSREERDRGEEEVGFTTPRYT